METIEEMTERCAKAIKEAGALTEEQLRDSEVPWFNNKEELMKYIDSLVDRPHDYGTCVYAMSMASVAMFKYVAYKLGTTGFQASCADLDFLKRIRRYKNGFSIVNYENLLYPQYCDDDHYPNWYGIINKNKK